MRNTKGIDFMKKLRTLGLGIVLAAGMAIFGAGVATAEEPSTGSAEILTSGSADDADAITEEDAEVDTGSAQGLAALLEALISGSAGGDDADADAITEEDVETPGTGSSEGLVALLQALTTGSAGAGDDVEIDD